MKGLKYLFLCLSLLIVAGACEDIEEPFVEFEDLEKGAFARLTDGINGEFNFFDVANSSINFTVEFYDENDGNNVEQYAWTVAYDDRSDADNDLPAVALRTFGKGDFSPNDRGLPSLTATFTFQEVLDAMGLTRDDINGGDAFILNATITKTDGSTFDANNTGANVIGQNTFNALFQIRQNVVCPSDLGGTYTATTTGISTDPCCPDEVTLTGEVTLEDQGSGVYEISDWSAGLYVEWYAAPYGITQGNITPKEITDACGLISGSFADGVFNGGGIELTGSVDEATGVITYTWTSSFGDEATVTLTPN